MKFKLLLSGMFVVFCGNLLQAQTSVDVLGMHNMGPGSKSTTNVPSPISGMRSDPCAYCHAPHSGTTVGLWNQTLTKQTYTMYSSTTEGKNQGKQPWLNSDSNHCLSCHDGTVAVGATVAYGQVSTSGAMYSQDVFGSNLQSSHPFSLLTPLVDNIDLAASLVANHRTLDTTGAVRLIRGNVECTSCHNPHIQAKDHVSQNFLVADSSQGHLCLMCHDPSRTISGQVNQMANWTASIHATSGATISAKAGLGSYSTVALDGCISCHAPHNAAGVSRLLRAINEQDCLTCHGTGTAITSGMGAYSNVGSEYLKPMAHPFPNSQNQHDAAESTILNFNRHATCVDCHNAHGTEQVTTFGAAPAIRVSQMNIAGVSASDGTTVLTPASNQYENCLRCHGTSQGNTGSASYGYFPMRDVIGSPSRNVFAEFATTASSSHPVMHISTSTLSQNSLRHFMENEDGSQSTRAMGNQIFCTDCHNSDDNREFGGKGPNGPHGSQYSHILERQYVFNTAVTPGGTVQNLNPSPAISVTGPYALCDKCHDVGGSVLQNQSWNQHFLHISTWGFSCSVCHSAHGVPAQSGASNLSGERLVNFDMNVVAQNAYGPVTYSEANNSCELVCHNAVHHAGTVSIPSVRKGRGIVLRK